MEDLTQEERDFLISLTKRKPQKYKGYMRFTKGNKHFKRSRVVMQLHLNKKLNIFEVVHHIDIDKTNDNIQNLKLTTAENHPSEHRGIKQGGKVGGHNKISKEIEQQLYLLCEKYKKKNGSPNYERIGRELNLAGQTIRKYHLNL